MKIKYLILSGIALFVFVNIAFGQISILPPAVYIDPQTNTGTTNLQNQTNTPKEVTIDFEYGFLNYDKDGLMFLDSADRKFDKFNLKPYVKAFPRKILIPAYGQQTVRFFCKPETKLTDGTYWTRFIISSREPKKQVDSSGGKGLQLDLRLTTKNNSVVIFPKGKCKTELKIRSHSFGEDKDNVFLYINFEKNPDLSPFWGTINFTVKNPSGSEIVSDKKVMQVYDDARVRYNFDKKLFGPGKHTFEIMINNVRDEIPENFRLKFNPLSTSFIYNSN